MKKTLSLLGAMSFVLLAMAPSVAQAGARKKTPVQSWTGANIGTPNAWLTGLTPAPVPVAIIGVLMHRGGRSATIARVVLDGDTAVFRRAFRPGHTIPSWSIKVNDSQNHQWTFTNVTLGGITMSTTVEGGRQRPTESLSLNFTKVQYQSSN